MGNSPDRGTNADQEKKEIETSPSRRTSLDEEKKESNSQIVDFKGRFKSIVFTLTNK